MATKKAVIGLSARLLGGVVGLAIGAAAIAGAVIVPWPSTAATPPAVQVDPVPAESTRVCPGPLLAQGADSSDATGAVSLGSASTFTAGDSDPSTSALAVPDDVSGDGDGTPTLISVQASGDSSAAALAGSQTQSVTTDTAAGFAAAACTEASTDLWLVAGSTDVGRSALVLLSNPSDVLATVDLAIFGESGAVQAPGASGIAVQPKSQRVVSLAGLAPDVVSPVIHVKTTTGQIAAALETSIVRGLVPGGIDLVGPSVPPSTAVTIPGFEIPDGIAAADNDDAETSDSTPGIRLLAPGSAAASATVSITGDGGGSGASFTVDLEPGVAVEAPIAGLDPGSYSISITADQPVIAAARSVVAGDGGQDIAWYAAAPPLDESALVAVAAGPSPRLHLSNPGGDDAEVKLTIGKSARTVPVPAGSSVSVAVSASTRLTLDGVDSLVASIGYSSATALASFTIAPAGALASPVTVYTH